MNSIIDEIAKAEAQATVIRQEAAVASRDQVAAAQAKAQAQLNAVEEDGRELLRGATQQAEQEGKLLGEKIVSDRREEANIKCAAAKEKLPEAVSYLLRRVVIFE